MFDLINIEFNKYLNSIDNYKVLKITDIFDFITGVEPGSKNYYKIKQKDFIKFYRVGDMNAKCKTFILPELAKNRIVKEDDVLVSFDATVGRIAYGLNGSYSTGMKKISVSKKYINELDNSIVFAYFNNKEIQEIIKQNARGTTILHASSAIDVMEFKYNKKILNKYSRIISTLFKKMNIIKKENEVLMNLRDTLLPKLMNSEINLNNIEI